MKEVVEFALQLMPKADKDVILEKMKSFGKTKVDAETIVELSVTSYWVGYNRAKADIEEINIEEDDS